MATSKIKSIEFKKEFDSKFGKQYSHYIVFEDGVSGQINAKSMLPDKLKVGETLEYKVEEINGFKNIKAVPQQNNVFKANTMPKKDEGTQRAIIAQNALTNAVKRYEGSKDVSNELITTTAKYFFDWVLEVSKVNE